MKILYVITKANFGGAQRYVLEMATEAKRRGHEVSVAYGEKGLLVEKLGALDIQTHALSGLRRDIAAGAELKSFISLIRLLRALRPDAVHLNSSKAGGLGALAARVCGVRRVIFTAHGWAFNEDRPFWQKEILKIVQWLTVILSHTTIVVADHDYRQVCDWPFVIGKITTIYNGISSIDFLEKNAARQKLLPEKSDLLWIGAHSENKNKGIDYLLKAFARVREKLHSAIIVLIGSGPEEAHLQQLANELGIADRVYFLGFIDNARTYLKAFDIYALPSRKEGLPYTLLEAALAELPVVASHVGGIPEVIADTQNGYLTAPSDVVLLSARLAELTENEELRKRFGAMLAKKVRTTFSPTHMFEKTFATYSHT